MSDLETSVNTAESLSVFECAKQTREDGTEYWTARDLMTLLDYSTWQKFQVPLERAMKSAENQNIDLNSAFNRMVERVKAGDGTATRTDYHLSRVAAYLVTMNGDPNKIEVAEAQAYFAVQTRFAEKVQESGVLTAAASEAISVYELGTLYSETMDTFTRTVNPANADSLTASALAGAMHELAKAMTYRVAADAPMLGATTAPSLPYTSSVPEIAAWTDAADGDPHAFVSRAGEGHASARLSPIDIDASAVEPITYMEFAELDGVERCQRCGAGLSAWMSQHHATYGFSRGRNARGNNVFPHEFWRVALKIRGGWLDRLHNDHARHHGEAAA